MPEELEEAFDFIWGTGSVLTIWSSALLGPILVGASIARDDQIILILGMGCLLSIPISFSKGRASFKQKHWIRFVVYAVVPLVLVVLSTVYTCCNSLIPWIRDV